MPGTPDSTEAVGGSETLSIATISSTPDVGTVDELDGQLIFLVLCGSFLKTILTYYLSKTNSCCNKIRGHTQK